MIDWFRGEIDFMHHALKTGYILSVTPDSNYEWLPDNTFHFTDVPEWTAKKRFDARGSYESSVFLRSVDIRQDGISYKLAIDGNLSKFLQGHNLFGSRDLNRLLELTFLQIIELGYVDPFYCEIYNSAWKEVDDTLKLIRSGDYAVNMIDINQLYDVGNDRSVENWLYSASMRAKTRHGRSTVDKGTVYLGKHSRRWALKFYNKYREMITREKGHSLPDQIQNEGLQQFAEGKLRAELRLLSLELKSMGITHGKHLSVDRINELFNEYIKKVQMSNQTVLNDELLQQLKPVLRGTLQLWRMGTDCRSMMPKPTFYRHRKLLLDYGIDISMPPLSPEHNNVVPMMRIIEAVPVENPKWAYERGLIAA